MVESVRTTERAIGTVYYGFTKEAGKNRVFRRSLFVVKDIKAGDKLTEENIKSIRPGYGLSPKYLKDVLGKKAKKDIKRGTPLNWELLE